MSEDPLVMSAAIAFGLHVSVAALDAALLEGSPQRRLDLLVGSRQSLVVTVTETSGVNVFVAALDLASTPGS